MVQHFPEITQIVKLGFANVNQMTFRSCYRRFAVLLPFLARVRNKLESQLLSIEISVPLLPSIRPASGNSDSPLACRMLTWNPFQTVIYRRNVPMEA